MFPLLAFMPALNPVLMPGEGSLAILHPVLQQPAATIACCIWEGKKEKRKKETRNTQNPQAVPANCEPLAFAADMDLWARLER